MRHRDAHRAARPPGLGLKSPGRALYSSEMLQPGRMIVVLRDRGYPELPGPAATGLDRADSSGRRDRRVRARATHGPDAATIQGYSRSTTDRRTLVTSTYVSPRQTGRTITDLPSL